MVIREAFIMNGTKAIPIASFPHRVAHVNIHHDVAFRVWTEAKMFHGAWFGRKGIKRVPEFFTILPDAF